MLSLAYLAGQIPQEILNTLQLWVVLCDVANSLGSAHAHLPRGCVDVVHSPTKWCIASKQGVHSIWFSSSALVISSIFRGQRRGGGWRLLFCDSCHSEWSALRKRVFLRGEWVSREQWRASSVGLFVCLCTLFVVVVLVLWGSSGTVLLVPSKVRLDCVWARECKDEKSILRFSIGPQMISCSCV